MSDWWLYTDIPEDPDVPPSRTLDEILRQFVEDFGTRWKLVIPKIPKYVPPVLDSPPNTFPFGIETKVSNRYMEDTTKEYPTSYDPWPAIRKPQTSVTLGKRTLHQYRR